MAFSENKMKEAKQSLAMVYAGPIAGLIILLANKTWELII
jgi:hypothetical protein